MPGKKLGELLKENPSQIQLESFFKNLLEEELLISFFNNKGGVGKSSSCAELAVILAQNGMKVLVVDADAQGSVSSRILHRNFIEVGGTHNPGESDEQILADLGEDYIRSQNLADQEQDLVDIHALFASVNSRPANPQELDRSVNRVKLFEAQMNTKSEREGGGVWVLMGALDLELLDSTISTSLTLGPTLSNANVSVPGALPMAIRSLARDRGFDVVFIDLNPAPTALNQCLLMGSNHFGVPYTAEFSSLRAVKNIRTIIPRWDADMDRKNLREAGLGKSVLHPVGCFPPKPTLLGAICHRVPAKIPNAYQRARASIMQQLLELSATMQNSDQEPSKGVVSFVVSEGYSTAVAAGLDGTALSDITKQAAKRIHQSKEGKTIVAKRHMQVGVKISAEYLFALTGMIAAMSEKHRQRLHEEQFKSNLEENKNIGQPTQSQNINKKRKQTNTAHEILVHQNGNIRYRLERVPGDGDCGLSALNIERENFCDTLRSVFFDEGNEALRPGARQYARNVSREMFELFSDPHELQHLPTQVKEDWERCHSKLDTKRQEVGRARAQWIAKLPENLKAKAEKIEKEEQFYDDPQLAAIAGDAQHQEIRASLLAWTQCVQQESQARYELQNFLATPATIKAFIDYLTHEHRWVGVQTLLLYARNAGISLEVHRLDTQGNVLPARAAEQYINPSSSVRHILYNGRNHFDRLLEQPAVVNANVASVATALYNPNNPLARRASQVHNDNDQQEKEIKKQKKK
ncbi:MAG: AAA family ATPase [Legionellales bacterium]|jgi:cellulose biosynthesis protein BcsQ